LSRLQYCSRPGLYRVQRPQRSRQIRNRQYCSKEAHSALPSFSQQLPNVRCNSTGLLATGLLSPMIQIATSAAKPRQPLKRRLRPRLRRLHFRPPLSLHRSDHLSGCRTASTGNSLRAVSDGEPESNSIGGITHRCYPPHRSAWYEIVSVASLSTLCPLSKLTGPRSRQHHHLSGNARADFIHLGECDLSFDISLCCR
jgi:hypothetical protein